MIYDILPRYGCDSLPWSEVGPTLANAFSRTGTEETRSRNIQSLILEQFGDHAVYTR